MSIFWRKTERHIRSPYLRLLSSFSGTYSVLTFAQSLVLKYWNNLALSTKSSLSFCVMFVFLLQTSRHLGVDLHSTRSRREELSKQSSCCKLYEGKHHTGPLINDSCNMYREQRFSKDMWSWSNFWFSVSLSVINKQSFQYTLSCHVPK